MNNKENNYVIMNGKSSLTRRIITWVTTFFFVFQSVGPTFARVTSDQSIENEVSTNYEFIRELTNAYYQYVGTPYINASAPVGDLTTIEEMFDTVIEEYDYAVGGTTYVPIGMGGITTFIPTHTRYKTVGDPLVQSRFVRTQIRALLGRALIDSSKSDLYGTEAQQLKTLFQNALSYIQSDPSKRIGDRLGFDQDAAPLAAPMIWPELRTVHGEEVLVPIVYLTATEMARRVTGNTTEINQAANFGDLIIEGTTVRLGRQAFLDVVNNLINNQGAIISDGDLNITIGGQLQNLSALIQAEGNLSITAQNIRSGTIVHQYETRNGTGGHFGEIAEINSQTGDVRLTAFEDIIIAGSLVRAGDDIVFDAAGNIYIGTVNVSTSENESTGVRYGWRELQSSSVEYLGSTLSAEDSINLIADGRILIDASEIVADNGHLLILAGLGITVQDRLNETQSYQAGKWNKTRAEISAYKTVAMRSLLDAGKDLTINSLFGDITLKAVDISTTEGTSVTATNGGINLLVTKETDHYSYSSVSKSLFLTTTINKGHDIETAVPTTIIGGFEANALYGLNVEYTGDPSFTFDQQVNALQQMPGMEWLLELRGRDDVDWTYVATKYEEWDERNTSLTPAALALITIIVTVFTAGAATGIAASAGGAASTAATAAGATAASSAAIGTTVGAAAAAASVSLITAATIAAASSVVNGNADDPFAVLEDVFDTLHSSDTLRAAAIAAVTAGAVAALDAEFFNFEGATDASGFIVRTGTDLAGNPTYGLSLLGQVAEAAVNASVSAGIEIITSGGDLGDFEEIFLNNLALNAVNALGERLATEIGIASRPGANGSPPDINQLTQYIAHAAAGCLTGALTSEVNDGDTSSSCVNGAGGAVIGEFIGNLRVNVIESQSEAILKEAGVNQAYIELLIRERGYSPQQAFFNATNGNQRQYIDAQLRNLKQQGVNIARLGAAVSAFLAGGDPQDINIAADAGANAAEHNAGGGLAIEQYIIGIFGGILGTSQEDSRLELERVITSLFNNALGFFEENEVTEWERFGRSLKDSEIFRGLANNEVYVRADGSFVARTNGGDLLFSDVVDYTLRSGVDEIAILQSYTVVDIDDVRSGILVNIPVEFDFQLEGYPYDPELQELLILVTDIAQRDPELFITTYPDADQFIQQLGQQLPGYAENFEIYNNWRNNILLSQRADETKGVNVTRNGRPIENITTDPVRFGNTVNVNVRGDIDGVQTSLGSLRATVNRGYVFIDIYGIHEEYRGNELSSELFEALIFTVGSDANQIEGRPAGSNISAIENFGVEASPWARSLNDLGYDTTYDPETNILNSIRR